MTTEESKQTIIIHFEPSHFIPDTKSWAVLKMDIAFWWWATIETRDVVISLILLWLIFKLKRRCSGGKQWRGYSNCLDYFTTASTVVPLTFIWQTSLLYSTQANHSRSAVFWRQIRGYTNNKMASDSKSENRCQIWETFRTHRKSHKNFLFCNLGIPDEPFMWKLCNGITSAAAPTRRSSVPCKT